YYRLNTVPLKIPPLRERKEDIYLLFRKFVADFTDKYRSPNVTLSPDAIDILTNYSWPGNVRQLKNIAEQISVLEKERYVTGPTLLQYIPVENSGNSLPMMIGSSKKEDFSERDLLYKVLFDMKKDMIELKKLVAEIINNGGNVSAFAENNPHILNTLYDDDRDIHHHMSDNNTSLTIQKPVVSRNDDYRIADTEAEEIEESLSLVDKEADMIKKALKKHKGKRKSA